MPGQREVAHVATPARLELVAQTLSELRGRRTRLELRADAAPPPPTEDDEPETPAGTRSNQLDRRAALQLPLVRAAMQAFPDAMLIDARSESPGDAPPDEPTITTPAAPDDLPDDPDAY